MIVVLIGNLINIKMSPTGDIFLYIFRRLFKQNLKLFEGFR